VGALAHAWRVNASTYVDDTEKRANLLAQEFMVIKKDWAKYLSCIGKTWKYKIKIWFCFGCQDMARN
jgi:hypothetical protein